MDYVIYDQFHLKSSDHFVMPVSGSWDYIMEVYNFEKSFHPDLSLGLVTKDRYKEILKKFDNV